MMRILNSLKNCSEWLRNTKWYEITKDYFSYFRKFFVFRSPLFVVRVEGESAWPYLVPGKRYVASGLVVPRVGDWAVFKNPREQERVFVKRVKAVCGREYFMEGAVSWSSSSRDFGLVERRLVLGKVLRHGTAN